MNYNPKEKYFLKNWKRLNARERMALSKNISFFNISNNRTYKLSVEFLKEYEHRIAWEQYSAFGDISEEVLFNFHHRLDISSVFLKNDFREEFILENISLFRNSIPTILTTQHLTKDTIMRLKTFYELAC